jgi:uncharacterized protein YgbK (DUF1537 family)
MARVVFIGDDFTGASDTLATLCERGARARLFLDAPKAEEIAGLDAVGIATDLRARPPEEIAARVNALTSALRTLSPRFVHYKVCSTFDSAPHIGSIGAAVKALEATLFPSQTVVVGGQPSLGRYCLFGTLFARAPDGEAYRIDRHPIMSRHPVTPMDEADLRVHLARQGLDGLSLTGRKTLDIALKTDRTLVDAIEQQDIDRLGMRLAEIDSREGPVLLVGASSVAEALFPAEPAVRADTVPLTERGPVLAIAGSRSSATANQVAAADSYERFALKREDLARPEDLASRCASRIDAGANVMVHLRPDLDYGRMPAELSDWLAHLTGAILNRCRAAGIAVAGGDTSSVLVKQLGFRSLSFIERAGPGVAVCRGHAAGTPLDGTVLLLKGGQVGAPDLFQRFAARFLH